MKFEEALELMEQLNKRGIHEGLEGIKKLTKALGNPEKGQAFIHVTGTNGKGSTSLFIAEILKAAGYKVGVYSSPKVFSETEIIKVNGRAISKADYAGLVEKVIAANEFGCTRFEVETAMALCYFKAKEVDITIMEVGMGGLLDATNIIPAPLACVFTPISMDHSDYLGSTLSEIAKNKAGIIKEGSAVVSAPEPAEVIKVLKDTALRNGSILDVIPEDIKASFRTNVTTFDFDGYKALKIKMQGINQASNAALAIRVIRDLSVKGIKVSETAIRKGLSNAFMEGRFEIIKSSKNIFVLDGAHNPGAAGVLSANIDTYFPEKKLILIMGMFRDKDCEEVIKTLAPKASFIITVTLPNKTRSLSSFELANMILPVNQMVTSADGIEEAVEIAKLVASQNKDTVIMACGSLSHLATIKKSF